MFKIMNHIKKYMSAFYTAFLDMVLPTVVCSLAVGWMVPTLGEVARTVTAMRDGLSTFHGMVVSDTA